MRIAFNPSTVEALITPPNNKDITFDLRGQNIFARGVKFCGTDTNTWRDIKINNVSIDSNTLDLRDGDNTTLTNINGVVTINSTWRPVVDNLTSDSTTSSLSANLGRVLKALIDGKSDSDHNHDSRYVKKAGDTMSGVLTIDTTNFGALTIKRNDDANGASIQFRGKSSVYGYIGLNNSTKDKQFLRWNSDTSKTYIILDTSSTYVSNGKGVINSTTITQVDNATNASVASKVYGQVGDTGSHELVRCDMNNDQFRIIAGSNGNNNGWAEIATADDGNEPIYVRQYTGVFSTIRRTLTLLDGNGNTVFPGSLSIGGNIIFPNSSHLLWNSGSWYLRILLNDDSTADTSVFTFLQSSDSGTNWSNLMTIRDNGKIIANTFVGDLLGNASTATALTTNAGNSINPVYFSGGKPIACTMSTGRGNGIVRSFSRGTYTSANQYFGNGTIVTIDPKGTGCISANDTILSLGDTSVRNTQLLVAWDRDGVYYRRITDNLDYGNWNRLAFTTDNVASATKLQTSRLLWGQLFNGTANVDGTINVSGTSGNYNQGIRIHTFTNSALSSIWFRATNTDGYQAGMWGISVDDNGMRFRGNTSKTATSDPIDYMNILHGGNVGIGTTNPSSKLTINGDISLFNVGSIRNLAIGGGIYWNPYVESTTDGSDSASITLVKSGVAGGTTLVLSLMNDANDTILFQTNGSARLYHNSYPILTTLNTYVSNNKGYINNTEITLVNNANKWTTSRTFTVGNTSKSVDGSSNVSWSLSEIGAASSNHNHDNRYVRKWTGVYGSANKFLKLAISNEKGWIRLEVSDSNNSLTAGYGIYIIGWGWHGDNGTDTLFARCLYANDSRYTTALKIVRTSRNNYDFYFLFASGSSYPSYTINYSSSISSIDCTVTAIDTIPTATWTSSLSALQLNASQVDWSGITNKPSAFNPAAHTHTVFNNNLMIKGTNGISDSASIHLGIGDSDTGFKWISDGKCLIYANNVAVGEWTSGGMNWFKNPIVNGNKVWNAGNDGSGSGLDADTVDGVHANQLCRIYTFNVHNSIIKVGTLTSGQSGHVCKLRFNSGIGYNAGNQDKTMTVVIRASNGGANSNGFYFEAHSESYRGGAFTTFYLHQTSKTQCELYMAAFNWSGQSTYEVSFSNGDLWTNEISVQNTLPTSNIFTLLNYQIAYTDYNVASATKLQTARKIWGQSFDGTADVNGTIYINNSDSSNGAIRLNNNVNSNARISAISDQVIFNTGSAIRFGGTSWDFNQWAGLKYTHSNKTIYLGIADNSIFNANSTLSGGTLKFPGITTITPDSGARIGDSDGDLYLGNASNSAWVKVQDMCSQEDSNNWCIYQAGDAYFNTIDINGDASINGNLEAGQIIRGSSGLMWVNGRNGALLRETTSTGYHTLWSLKTTNGSWDFGEYNSSGWNNVPVLSYITDSNYNSGNNTPTYQIKFPLASGTVALINDVNNYYWANVKISASASTTTSPTVHTLTATRVCAGHNPEIDNSISCSNWFRSSGATGWYNTTYLGGWYMSDTSWIRAHNGVGIYTSGQIYSPSSIRMGNILLEHTDEINNSANGSLYLNYRNSGNISLCQGGGNVGIGTTSPSYKLDVNGLVRASGFIHSDYSINDAVLLAGGGYKTLSDLTNNYYWAYDNKYIKLPICLEFVTFVSYRLTNSIWSSPTYTNESGVTKLTIPNLTVPYNYDVYALVISHSNPNTYATIMTTTPLLVKITHRESSSGYFAVMIWAIPS